MTLFINHERDCDPSGSANHPWQCRPLVSNVTLCHIVHPLPDIRPCHSSSEPKTTNRVDFRCYFSNSSLLDLGHLPRRRAPFRGSRSSALVSAQLGLSKALAKQIADSQVEQFSGKEPRLLSEALDFRLCVWSLQAQDNRRSAVWKDYQK